MPKGATSWATDSTKPSMPHSTRLRHSWYGVSRPAAMPTAGEAGRRGWLHPATALRRHPRSFTRLRHGWYGVSRPAARPTAGEAGRRGWLHPATALRRAARRAATGPPPRPGLGRAPDGRNRRLERKVGGMTGADRVVRPAGSRVADRAAGSVVAVLGPRVAAGAHLIGVRRGGAGQQ